jgi:predicted transcriptional regulator
MTEELTGNTKKVFEAMVKLGTKGEEKAKSMEDIVRESKLPKGTVANSITELTKLKLVKRRSGEKTARYFIME